MGPRGLVTYVPGNEVDVLCHEWGPYGNEQTGQFTNYCQCKYGATNHICQMPIQTSQQVNVYLNGFHDVCFLKYDLE